MDRGFARRAGGGWPQRVGPRLRPRTGRALSCGRGRGDSSPRPGRRPAQSPCPHSDDDPGSQPGVDGIELGNKTALELGDKDRAKAGIEGRSAHDIEQLRERWADLTNRALEREGRAERIDHRSLAAPGHRPRSHHAPWRSRYGHGAPGQGVRPGRRQPPSDGEQRRAGAGQRADYRPRGRAGAAVRSKRPRPPPRFGRTSSSTSAAMAVRRSWMPLTLQLSRRP